MSVSASTTINGIRIHQVGDASQMKYEQFAISAPGPKQLLIKQFASGVNYIDTYQRTGLYKVPLPAVLGREGAGVIEAIGSEVTDFKVGDRVVYMSQGTYAEKVIIDATAAAQIPNDVTYEQAAAIFLQGLTAHYLTHDSYNIKKGDTVLVHAAAGGTGALVVQMAKLRGATVIGTVGSAAKAEIAREAGSDYIINYSTEDFLTRVKEITNGEGVHAVYDGVGASTWENSLKSCRRRGTLVLFGNASGPVPPINPLLLSQNGSLFVTRPTLADFIATRAELDARAADVFGWIGSAQLHVRIAATFPLAQTAAAHELLESRKATGKILISIP